MLDRKSKRIVELNSTPEFDLQAVTTAMETLNRNGMEHVKFCNEDLPLLIRNLTPFQFDQLETAHMRMLKEQCQS